MIKKAIGIVAALALFVAGTMLVVGYVRNTEERLVAEVQPTEIMVVSQPVSAGESPEAALRVEEFPSRLVSDDAVRPNDTLNGLVASVDLVPGEPMLWSRLIEPEQVESGERTRIPIPEGMSAVTIPVTPERTFGGLLLPGMTVAVVGSFSVEVEDGAGEVQTIEVTHAMVQKALVVEVQADDPPDPTGTDDLPTQLTAANLPTGGFFVTIAVPIYDVERIVFAAEWGSIWLAEQGEAASEDARIQTMATVLEQVDPDEPPADDFFSAGRTTSVLPFAEPLDREAGQPQGLRDDPSFGDSPDAADPGDAPAVDASATSEG